MFFNVLIDFVMNSLFEIEYKEEEITTNNIIRNAQNNLQKRKGLVK